MVEKNETVQSVRENSIQHLDLLPSPCSFRLCDFASIHAMPRKPDPNPPKRPRLEAYYCKLCIKDFKTPRGLSAHESRPGHVQKRT
jgi:hypothetical protein